MKIRETYKDPNTLRSGDVIDLEHNSIEMLADDGRTMYTIDLNGSGELSVHASSVVKHNGRLLDSTLLLSAKGPNWFIIKRANYD